MTFALSMFGILLALVSVFLMLIILVQRGKGGGLTGALGGMGGQSAFGAKAGDAFTKITTVTSIIWITLCMLTIAIFNPPPRKNLTEKPAPTVSAPAKPAGAGAGATPADKTGEATAKPSTDEAKGNEENKIDLFPEGGNGKDKPADNRQENSEQDGGGTGNQGSGDTPNNNDKPKGDDNSNNGSPGDG